MVIIKDTSEKPKVKKNPRWEEPPSRGPRMSRSITAVQATVLALPAPQNPLQSISLPAQHSSGQDPAVAFCQLEAMSIATWVQSIIECLQQGPSCLYTLPDLLVSSQQTVSPRCKGFLCLRWPPTLTFPTRPSWSSMKHFSHECIPSWLNTCNPWILVLV